MLSWKSFPAGKLFMILLLALAGLGLAYGLRSGRITLQAGMVYTGAFTPAFSVHEVDEGLERGVPEGPTDNEVNEDKEAGSKEVAECSAAPNDSGDPPDLPEDGPQHLLVTIANGYPSFHCYIDFDVHNYGSIPIIIHSPVVTGAPPSTILNVEFLYCYQNDAELLAGEEAFCTLHVHLEQQARPLHGYQFSVEIFSDLGREPLYLYEKNVFTDWSIVDGGAWGMLHYPTAYPTFDYQFFGHLLNPGMDYTLIYYGAWSNAICLGSGIAAGDGELSFSGDPDLNLDLVDAKIWLVPTADVNCISQAMTAWEPAKFLFENNIINYDDTDVP